MRFVTVYRKDADGWRSIIVNIAAIDSITTDDQDATWVSVGDTSYLVRESPEQILKMIGAADGE